MKKLLVAVLALSLTAASCNIFSGAFDTQSGSKGVFKSEDNAQSFHASNKIANKKNDIGNLSVNVLAPDPRNNDTIYLGYSGGVYRTKDGANSWEMVLTGIGIADIAIDSTNPDTVYAAGLSGSNGKIIRSVDGGSSWTEVYTEPTKTSPVTSIAVSRDNSNLVLAGLGTGEIIRSTDQGKTWQVTQDMADRVARIKQSGANFYAMLLHKGLARSANQGSTWTLLPAKDLGQPVSAPQGADKNYLPSLSGIANYYDIALDPNRPGLIYMGTDKGLAKSTTDGSSWAFVPMPVTDSNLAVTAVALTPGDTNAILAAIGPVIFKSQNGGATWENRRLTTDQTVRTILISTQATNLIYLGMGVKK
ncbi:MAG: VPS10 domain-containing protein [Candidatus Saccharibacteria bacterium]